MKRLVSVILLSGGILSPLGAAESSVTLHVTPLAAVLGIPPSLTVAVTNRSNCDASRPAEVALLVYRADDAEPFFARTRLQQVVAADTRWNDLPSSIAPGGSATLYFPAELSLLEPRWFLDERLRKPGKYRLQVAVIPAEFVRDRLDSDSSAPVMTELSSRGYLSNAVEFSVIAPTGDDAAVCALVEAKFHDNGCPVHRIDVNYDLISEIRDRYPNSSYTAYLLGRAPVGNRREDRIQLYEAAIKASGNSLVADWYRLALAQEHEIESRCDVPAVKNQHLAAAQKLWEEISVRSHVDALRATARQKLRLIRDEESLAEK